MSVPSFEFINFVLFIFNTIIAALYILQNIIQFYVSGFLITTPSFKFKILQLILRESNQTDFSAVCLKAPNSEHAGLWICSQSGLYTETLSQKKWGRREDREKEEEEKEETEEMRWGRM